jgi:hypothetical protein
MDANNAGNIHDALFYSLSSPPLSLPQSSVNRLNPPRFASQLGISNGSQTALLMMQRRKYKHNGSQPRQMFSGRSILTSFCCRRCGITKRLLGSVKPSRRECITSQFALRSRNHSRADSVNSKWRYYPNIKRKRHGQNAGSR